MDLPISEYMSRAQLKKIADDTNQRNVDRLRIAHHLQSIREQVLAAAREGHYSWSTTGFPAQDTKTLEGLVSRIFTGCSVVATGDKLSVYWS